MANKAVLEYGKIFSRYPQFLSRPHEWHKKKEEIINSIIEDERVKRLSLKESNKDRLKEILNNYFFWRAQIEKRQNYSQAIKALKSYIAAGDKLLKVGKNVDPDVGLLVTRKWKDSQLWEWVVPDYMASLAYEFRIAFKSQIKSAKEVLVELEGFKVEKGTNSTQLRDQLIESLVKLYTEATGKQYRHGQPASKEDEDGYTGEGFHFVVACLDGVGEKPPASRKHPYRCYADWIDLAIKPE